MLVGGNHRMTRRFVFIIILALLWVGPLSAQEPAREAYESACALAETDLDAAAEHFEMPLEEVAYVNRGSADHTGDYLIRPGCFFSATLANRPLYADVAEQLPFAVQIIEQDAAFTLLVPGEYVGEGGYDMYEVRDFAFAADGDRWLMTGMAVLAGFPPFGGHGIALSNGGIDIRLEYDWIGQTFMHTVLVPDGPALTVQAAYPHDGPVTGFGLTALDFDSGDTLWAQSLDEQPLALHLLSPELVAVAYADHIDVVAVEDGETRWQADDTRLPLAVSEAALLVQSGGALVALDITSGDRLWSQALDTPYTQLTAVGAFVLGVSADGALHLRALADGAVVWEAATESGLTPAAATCDANHDCWLASADAESVQLEQFDLATGTLRAAYPLPGETAASPLAIRVQPDGWVLVLGNHLHARTPLLAH